MALRSAKLPGLMGLARPLLPVGAVALVLSVRAASFGDAAVVRTVLFGVSSLRPDANVGWLFPAHMPSPHSLPRLPRPSLV